MHSWLMVGWFFYAFLTDSSGAVTAVPRVGPFVTYNDCEETRMALVHRISSRPVVPGSGMGSMGPYTSPSCVQEKTSADKR